MVLVLMRPFGSLMQSQTGINGELVPVKTVDELGKQIAEDKIQLGVFHGFEFAWARQKHPELQPLMIAVNQNAHLKALVLVRDDCNAQTLGDLKGQKLALPARSREHCRLYLDHHCRQCDCEMKQLFDKITTPANYEEAMDDLVDDQVQVTIVDNVAMEAFKRRKPGRFAKLKVLHESEIFPAAVIAYRPGALDDGTVKKFRDGLLTAGQTPVGRQLMTLWQLTAFEGVPADYEQLLTDIGKAYPAPVAKEKVEKAPMKERKD
jgi:ABC-type phosphate/phosphonate transport system substrate-binding protein